MSYICGDDRSQEMLLPVSIDGYIDAEHPVRAIDAFVESLDLRALGFAKSQPAATGRPPYHPADLLKLFVWGYLNRVHSSRRLEVECGRNLELLWLMCRLQPDFKTIADFRRDNREALKSVFREFALLCRELGLYGQQLFAIDGTKLKASNNPAHRGTAEKIQELIKEVDARIEEYLAAMEQSDTDLLGQDIPAQKVSGLAKKLAVLRGRKERFAQALKVAQRTGEKAPLVDPDCQSMKKVGLGYNAQIAVDDQHHLIAAAEIVDQPTDHEQLAPMAEAVRQTLDIQEITAVADAGYHDRAALAAAEAAGVIGYVPQPDKGQAATRGVYHKNDFRYDSQKDAYHCPAGQVLERKGVPFAKHGVTHSGYANPEACRACLQKAACTGSPYRRIDRCQDDAAVETMAARVAAHPEMVRKRKALVEHPFGTIKFWRTQGAMLTRGRRSVQAELSLSALAYNLTRVLAILGVKTLIEAIAARKNGVLGAFLRAYTGLEGVLRVLRANFQPSQVAERLRAVWRRTGLRRLVFDRPEAGENRQEFSHSLATWERGNVRRAA
jgi:transposase